MRHLKADLTKMKGDSVDVIDVVNLAHPVISQRKYLRFLLQYNYVDVCFQNVIFLTN